METDLSNEYKQRLEREYRISQKKRYRERFTVIAHS